ncbi:MAG: Flp family type IVb pilin [Rhizobiales bacterium PAR1]|nr:MAG: Flp family type IVb pilin [Rhizobiales bacterium PAR1]
MQLISRFIKNDSGATAVEYALIAALMASAIIAALTTFDQDQAKAFKNIGTTLTTKTK